MMKALKDVQAFANKQILVVQHRAPSQLINIPNTDF